SLVLFPLLPPPTPSALPVPPPWGPAVLPPILPLVTLLLREHGAHVEHHADARFLHRGAHRADLVELRLDGAPVRRVGTHELAQIELGDAQVGLRADRRTLLAIADVGQALLLVGREVERAGSHAHPVAHAAATAGPARAGTGGPPRAAGRSPAVRGFERVAPGSVVTPKPRQTIVRWRRRVLIFEPRRPGRLRRGGRRLRDCTPTGHRERQRQRAHERE